MNNDIYEAIEQEAICEKGINRLMDNPELMNDPKVMEFWENEEKKRIQDNLEHPEKYQDEF